MEIERMKISDIAEVLEIEKISFASPWSIEMFEQELLMGRYFAAKEGGKIIGYVGYQRVLDEGHITNLAVHPDFRRHGIGRKLVEKSVEEAKSSGLKSLILEVREKNTAAQKLYESLGFSNVGRRKGYYQEPVEDAILMARNL